MGRTWRGWGPPGGARATRGGPPPARRLGPRHQGAGDGPAVARSRERWAAMAGEVRAHLAAGTDPADPAVQETARRWSALMDEMTGGDRAFAAGMYARI